MWGTAGLEVAMPSSAEKSEEDGKNTVLSSVAVAQNLMDYQKCEGDCGLRGNV